MTQEQWQAGRQPLSAENEVVLDVWRFCGGWNPAVLPIAAEFYGVEDVEFLIVQLIVLRDTIDAHRAAQRRA